MIRHCTPPPGTVWLPFPCGSLHLPENPTVTMTVPGFLNQRQLTSPQGRVERGVTGKRSCENCRGLLPISHGSSPPFLHQRRGEIQKRKLAAVRLARDLAESHLECGSLGPHVDGSRGRTGLVHSRRRLAGSLAGARSSLNLGRTFRRLSPGVGEAPSVASSFGPSCPPRRCCTHGLPTGGRALYQSDHEAVFVRPLYARLAGQVGDLHYWPAGGRFVR